MACEECNLTPTLRRVNISHPSQNQEGWAQTLIHHSNMCLTARLHCSPVLAEVGRSTMKSGRMSIHLQHRPIIDNNHSGFSAGVGSKAAPAPLVRGIHQSAPNRVAMDVFQFLYTLPRAPKVEVVKPPLPETALARIVKQFWSAPLLPGFGRSGKELSDHA